MEGEIALMIPILGILLGFFGVWTNHKQKIAKIEASALAENTAEKAAQYAAGNRELEERVRVLERIVTDGGYNVASQIEALRDARRVDRGDSGVPLDIERKERV